MSARMGTSLWRALILYVTGIVLAVFLLSSGAFGIYINGVLRKNAESSFLDLSDKLAQNITTLLRETELLGRAIARDTVLEGAMLRTDALYPVAQQYDDYFEIRAMLAAHQDHKQIDLSRLIFRHRAFYTREGVSLLSAQSDTARALGLGAARFTTDKAAWEVHEGTIRYVQPVLNYKYASQAVGLVVLELSNAQLASLFSGLKSLEDARYELFLADVSVRIFGVEGAAANPSLQRTIELGHGFQLRLSASDLRHAVHLWQSLMTFAPWILCGCLLVFLVFSLFAKRAYREIASLARAISTMDVLGDAQIESVRYQELSVIVSHFNGLLGQIRKKFAQEILAQEKERALALRMLESQINPHFLYNSLDVINWLSYQQGAEDVATLARSLGTFYRDALSKTSNLNALHDELTHVRTYLSIMRCRTEGEIALEVDVEDGFLHAMLPRLSLQPIVENAVQHGILRRADQQGHIRVHAYREGAALRISVRDDGPGMSQEALNAYMAKLSIWPPEEMHGLINIHQRAQLLFGNGYGVALLSQEGAYMEVVLSVPAGV